MVVWQPLNRHPRFLVSTLISEIAIALCQAAISVGRIKIQVSALMALHKHLLVEEGEAYSLDKNPNPLPSKGETVLPGELQ